MSSTFLHLSKARGSSYFVSSILLVLVPCSLHLASYFFHIYYTTSTYPTPTTKYWKILTTMKFTTLVATFIALISLTSAVAVPQPAELVERDFGSWLESAVNGLLGAFGININPGSSTTSAAGAGAATTTTPAAGGAAATTTANPATTTTAAATSGSSGSSSSSSSGGWFNDFIGNLGCLFQGWFGKRELKTRTVLVPLSNLKDGINALLGAQIESSTTGYDKLLSILQINTDQAEELGLDPSRSNSYWLGQLGITYLAEENDGDE